jgi:hypothetical protein
MEDSATLLVAKRDEIRAELTFTLSTLTHRNAALIPYLCFSADAVATLGLLHPFPRGIRAFISTE